jgi:gamma-glutamylaminecyclotransferase
MCVIIIKQKGKKLSEDVARSSARINPDGLGIIWLDTFEVSYHKSNEYELLLTKRPFIAHFRYATIGKVSKDNTHPFRCGKNENEWLMMNGTIHGLGSNATCDSKVLAKNLGDAPRHTWKSKLETYECRFVTINTRNKTFQVYNKEMWTIKDNVWYSKDNVLEDNLVAVYGTLKKGYSNYWAYLLSSKHIGSGKTAERYPLIVNGLPYLIENRGVGYNVKVDVFSVSNSVLKRLDALEGHPNWYYRKQIKVNVDGKSLMCWIYFNPKSVGKHDIFKEEYTQPERYVKHFDLFDKQEPVTKYDGKIMFSDILDEEDEFSIDSEKPICIDCFHDLEFDGFANFHCKGCEGWFSESEVYRFRC